MVLVSISAFSQEKPVESKAKKLDKSVEIDFDKLAAEADRAFSKAGTSRKQNRYTLLFEEADRAFSDRAAGQETNKYTHLAEEAARTMGDIEGSKDENRFEALAEEAASEADEVLAERIFELTAPVNQTLDDASYISEHDMNCLELLSLQVKLQTRNAKKQLKRKVRKNLLKQVASLQSALSCN
jgi:hypothetical protein